MNVPLAEVIWPKAHRLVNTNYPKADFFDDIAEPGEWNALQNIIARTNTSNLNDFANANTVPPHRRITGEGSGWVMNTFIYTSKNYPSRFSDGSYGVYYCAIDFDTAVHETCYHTAKFLKSTQESAGWISKKRHLITSVDAHFHDIRQPPNSDYLQKNNYDASQSFARMLRSQNTNGIIYPSVRYEKGECLAIFWPDIVGRARDIGIWQYHFDGERIDYIRKLDETNPTKIYAVMS